VKNRMLGRKCAARQRLERRIESIAMRWPPYHRSRRRKRTHACGLVKPLRGHSFLACDFHGLRSENKMRRAENFACSESIVNPTWPSSTTYEEIICILASAALLVACETKKNRNRLLLPLPAETENNTTVVNPPASTTESTTATTPAESTPDGDDDAGDFREAPRRKGTTITEAHPTPSPRLTSNRKIFFRRCPGGDFLAVRETRRRRESRLRCIHSVAPAAS